MGALFQKLTTALVESRYPRGYPSLTAFMNLEPKFDMFRRFGRLRIRALLYKQDELVELEEQLELVDSRDRVQLHLSSRRHDRNKARKDLLDQIDKKLAEYGTYFTPDIISYYPRHNFSQLSNLRQGAPSAPEPHKPKTGHSKEPEKLYLLDGRK